MSNKLNFVSRDTVLKSRKRSESTNRDLGLLGIVIGIGVLATVFHPGFAAVGNIRVILEETMLIGFVALGELLVIMTREIDLSVAAIYGLTANVVGMLASQVHLSIALAIILVIVMGFVLGTFNGVFVSIFRIPSIVVTLATLSIFQGITFLYLNGRVVNSMPANYTAFASSVIGGIFIPPTIIFVVFGTILAIILGSNQWGRSIYWTGGNQDAAHTLGVNVRLIKILVFAISGALAGWAGMVRVSYLGQAGPSTGVSSSLELTAIAAALIGGASLQGGRGTVVGTVIGSLFLAMVLSIVSFFHVPAILEQFGEGVLIVAVMVFDYRFRSSGQRNEG